ncbi:bifunctional protein-serine/threonine kinase/phosphatase [Bradyrhizobium prioriisuperbiae]|uniref:bifunctional protein-serine/threonine kinase/phosphatase n=1 Tax=Bradyrhizobium prioriisuperbiae TaxID=2854389 RepID=UPI0028E7BFCF|nr:protein kinase [Bradyrhizobium prioritasuperba]
MTDKTDRAPVAVTRTVQVVVRSGFSSERGDRPDNEDYVGIADGRGSGFGVVAVIADGVGGTRGGRIAAETAVRGFIEGYLGQAQHVLPKESSIRSLESVNRWIHSIGRRDPALQGMASTLTALICRGRQIHVVHVGDSRLYRLRGDQLQQLTIDHVAGPGELHVLKRAVGADDELRIDYINLPSEQHDRYLLCTDGVHGGVSDAALREILNRRASPEDTATEIVGRSIAARVGDNASALVIDVIELAPSEYSDIERAIVGKAIHSLPKPGATVDDFRIDGVLSDSRYVRVFRATDTVDGRQVVMKFPKPLEGADRPMRDAFLREMWIASRVRSPYVGEVLQLKADRQTRLYLVMPFYEGERLDQRLKRKPMLSLSAGLAIALKLARGVVALHRADVIHRDIKPENVILLEPTPGQGAGVKIIDFGVARQKATQDTGTVSEPGTPSFMAPELFEGQQANEATDQFALGVTIYRLFTGRFPYGEIEPFTHPKFRAAAPLSSARPDLPAWLGKTIDRAISLDPRERYEDVLEFIFELENGADRASPINVARKPLYQRNPLLFWKVTSALLAIALAVSLAATAVRKNPPRTAPELRSSSSSNR